MGQIRRSKWARLEERTQEFRQIIEFHTCGVSDTSKSATFYYAPQIAGLSGLRNRSVLQGHEVRLIQIELVQIDQIYRDANGPIHFLKIDIESGEYNAIRGASQTITVHQPIIVF